MTSKTVPKICDFCGKEVKSEVRYRAQISQVGAKWKKGAVRKFTKAQNDADMCHDCFMNMDKVGYKPDFITLTKIGESWLTPDEVSALQPSVTPPA